MTAWSVFRDKKSGTCTLTCTCGGCGLPAAAVLNESTYLKLIKDRNTPLTGTAGQTVLEKGRHAGCAGGRDGAG